MRASELELLSLWSVGSIEESARPVLSLKRSRGSIMKRFVFSALTCTALACPGLADDQLFVVECPAEPEAPIAEVVVDVPEVDAPMVEADAEVAIDAEISDVVKDVDVTTDGPVDITAVLDDGPLITTMTTDTERTDVDDPSIIYFSTTSTTTDTNAETAPSVNQLADEQRNSLRLFSGREASSEQGGKAANLKELFAARSALKADASAKTSAKLSVDERDVARRKAEIDQLRDKALRTGDSKLMARADAMAAAQARGGTKARTFLGFSFGNKK
jgi:hypothetical protein